MMVENAIAARPNADLQTAARLRAEFDYRAKITPAMLHSINEQGLLISVSDAWLAKLGYVHEEVIGRPLFGFLTPESRERAEQLKPAFFRDGRADDVQYQMVCKDGRLIDVLVSAVLDTSVEYGPVSLSVVTDVTMLKETKRRLGESEARYRGLVEDQSELVSLSSPDGVFRFVNHASARHYGLQPEDMVGRSLFDFVPAAQRGAVARHLVKVCQAAGSIDDKNQVILPNGRTRWMAWTNRAIRDEHGEVTGIHSVGRDIEDQVAAEQRLKESEARYRMLADHSSDMVFQLDRSLVRRYVSPACREILGYEPDEMLGVRPVSMTHPEDAARVSAVFYSLLNGQALRQSVTNRIRHRDGRWIWVEAECRALLDAGGTPAGIIGALRDISARKAVEDRLAEANQRLEVLAAQDGLTGLRNRRSFDDAFAREFRRARRAKKGLALLMIDVDWFKRYNDRYGHPAGDECLRQVGLAIAKTICREGDVSARYGGEEFAVLLPDTDEPGAATVAERVREAVLGMGIEHLDNAHRIVTISVGAAAQKLGQPEGTQWLLEHADRALYHAKALGRNTVARASWLEEAVLP